MKTYTIVTCPTCGAKPGEYHERGCPDDQCPLCGCPGHQWYVSRIPNDQRQPFAPYAAEVLDGDDQGPVS